MKQKKILIITFLMISFIDIKAQNPQLIINGNNNDCNTIATYYLENANPQCDYYWTLSGGGQIISQNIGYSITVMFDNTLQYCDTAILSVAVLDSCTTGITSGYKRIFACCEDNITYRFDNYTTQSPMTFSNNSNVLINGDFVMMHNVTFDNVNVYMSPDSRILLKEENISLNIINGTVISSNIDCCVNMWDGIYTNKESQTVKITGGSVITNAQHALNILQGSTFLLEDSYFTNNYKNLYVYQGSGGGTPSYPATISNMKFIGSNSLPYPPYQGLQTYSGIEVFRTDKLTIGDISSSINKNTFENMFCGIKIEQSYVEIYNNEIVEIQSTIQSSGSNPTQIYNATAIFCIGNPNINPQNYLWQGVKIGGSGLKRNFIRSCFNGIYGFNLLLNVDNNIIHTQNYGVEGRDMFDNSIINKNSISGYSMGTSNTLEGVRIFNIQPRDCNYTIVLNSIDAIQRGIFINNANSNAANNLKVNVNNNNINLTGMVQPQSKPFSGIHAGGCYGITINNNNLSISNIGIPTSANLYYGVDVAQVRNADILCNTNEYYGAGVNINGDCKLSRFWGNTLKDCFYGFYFNSQSTISQQGYYNGALSVNSENIWMGNYYDNILNQYRKLWANTNPGSLHLLTTGTRWYVRSTPLMYRLQNSTNNTAPYIYEDSSNPANIFYCQNSQPSMPSPIVNAQHRDELLANIVRDSNNYEQLEEQYKAYDKEAVYKALKEDATLLNMGATNDAEYQQFFTEMTASNIEKISEIENLIKNREDSLAMVKNAVLQDEKLIDEFRKVVNEIYLTTFARGNYDLTQEQIDILMPIAVNYTPWEGGDAVYIARNMLNLDMDAIEADFAKAPPKQFADVAPSNAKLYPNPAKDEVMIEFDNRLNTSAVFEIFNFEGLKIIDILLNKGNQYISVSTKNLKAGLYMYRISDNERIIAKDKLLIVK